MEKESYEKLRQASLSKNIAEMEKLLKEGADPNFPASQDCPLLFEVLCSSDSEEELFDVVSLLLKYKADVNGR